MPLHDTMRNDAPLFARQRISDLRRPICADRGPGSASEQSRAPSPAMASSSSGTTTWTPTGSERAGPWPMAPSLHTARPRSPSRQPAGRAQSPPFRPPVPLFARSDGAQPHLVNIQFQKKVNLVVRGRHRASGLGRGSRPGPPPPPLPFPSSSSAAFPSLFPSMARSWPSTPTSSATRATPRTSCPSASATASTTCGCAFRLSLGHAAGRSTGRKRSCSCSCSFLLPFSPHSYLLFSAPFLLRR